MIRILVVTPFSKDANSYFRCIGPWSYLTKMARAEGEEIQFSVAQDDVGNHGVAWDTLIQFDMVFLHRPCRDADLTILKIAKNLNIPVWIDYDDWLFEVPYWNPHAGVYNDPGLQHIMATCLATADVVTVTTSALYDRFREVNKNVVIIPNMYRSDLFPYRQKNPPARKREIAWRGTNTHDADVLSVADGWRTLPAKVNFYGGVPWLLQNMMPKDSFMLRGSQDPFLYMRTLYADAPKVMLVPLVDCLFNRVKSNIAYQEALHAGALVVAPNLPEWSRPGVYLYEAGNAASFRNAVTLAYDKPEDEHAKEVDEAFEEMCRLYDAGVINTIRLALVKAVHFGDHDRNTRDPFDQLTGIWALSKLKGTPGPKVAENDLKERGAE